MHTAGLTLHRRRAALNLLLSDGRLALLDYVAAHLAFNVVYRTRTYV